MTDDPDAALMDAIVQLSFTVTAVLTTAGAVHDLSLSQLRLLGILRDREPTMAGLADFLGLDRSTISGLVDRAGRRGLVERVPHPDDRRSSRVRLTDAGRSLAAEVADDVAGPVAALTDVLTPRRRADLTDLLRAVLPDL